MLEILEAFYREKRVYIPEPSKAMELREKGFGSLKKDKVFLSPYEVFYLVEKGRIRVIDKESKEELGLRTLVSRLSANKPEVWIKYLIYRDLRDRGYIVREFDKVGFEIHGKGALRRLVSIVYEGRRANLEDLEEFLKIANREKKELILAVIDRRTDIVYYSLSELQV
ncbi:MAG: hypothetical protein QW265_04585 [Candidatus Bathyarchaeia archaeon]